MKLASTYKQIWSIALPIMIGGIAQNAIHVVNTIFLSKVGVVELGAGALAGVFYFVMIMIAFGFCMGVQILFARRSGEGDSPGIGKTADHFFVTMFFFSCFLFIVIKFGSPAFLKGWIDSPRVYESCIRFLDYRSFGIFFACMIFAINAFFTGIGRTKIIMVSAIVMSAVNILGDYTLIFGNFGFENMGIAGAATASVIAEACGLAVLIGYIFLKKYPQRYLLFKTKIWDWQLVKHMFSIASPLIFQSLIGLSGWLIFFMMIEKMGENELAVSNILRSIYMMVAIPTWGLASSANTLVSNLLGQKKPDDVIPVTKKIISLSLIINAILIIALISLSGVIMEFYTEDPHLIKMGKTLFVIVAGAMLIFSVCSVSFHALTGTGSTKIALFAEINSIIFYIAYIYATVNVFHLSLAWVWASEWLYWIVIMFWVVAYMKSGRWKKVNV